VAKLNICKQCGKKLRMKEVQLYLDLCKPCIEKIINESLDEYIEQIEKARMN